MKWLIIIAIILASLMVVNKARSSDETMLPPYVKQATPGKVCTGFFDRQGELIGMDCDVTEMPKVKDNGKKEPIRKGE